MRDMENGMRDKSLDDFAAELASRAPVPGGGGAAALAGALASALASMVCKLTAGKKKYAVYEDDIQRIAAEAERLRMALLRDIDLDAQAFEPLSRAYSIPKDAPGRAEVMENALRAASAAPMGVAERCCAVIGLLAELAEKGSAIAVSDVGVGAELARAALISAGLNVRINAKTMADREYAGELLGRLEAAEARFVPMADQIYRAVLGRIGR